LCQWLPAWHSLQATPQLSPEVTPFPPTDLPQLQSAQRKGRCSGTRLRVTEGSDLLLIPPSHAIFLHSFLFHGLTTSPSRVPAQGNTGDRRCLRLPAGRLPSNGKRPAEHRSTLRSQGKADRPGKQPCWESRAQHPALGPTSRSAPVWAWPPCSGWHGTPGAGRRNMGAGRQGTLSDAALTSLGHTGPWMLPPALARAASRQRARPGSPRFTCSFALWFLPHAAVKKPKASPRQRRQSCPAPPRPRGAPRPGDAPQSSCQPGCTAPAPASPHKHLRQPQRGSRHQNPALEQSGGFFMKSHPGPALLNTLGQQPGKKAEFHPGKVVGKAAGYFE